MSDATYRAPAALRAALAVAGGVCAVAAARCAWIAVTAPDVGAMVAACIVALPCVVAASALRARWQVGADSLRTRTLLRERLHAWPEVWRVDRTRASFIVETPAGPLRPVWLSGAAREALLKVVVAQAGLSRTYGDLPFGIVARYVPRPAGGPMLSHAQRRERERAITETGERDGDSGR